MKLINKTKGIFNERHNHFEYKTKYGNALFCVENNYFRVLDHYFLKAFNINKKCNCSKEGCSICDDKGCIITCGVTNIDKGEVFIYKEHPDWNYASQISALVHKDDFEEIDSENMIRL